jgi:hypothetical protein
MSRADGTLGKNLGLVALGVAAATALYVYSSSSSSPAPFSGSAMAALKSSFSSPSSSSRDSQVMRSVIDLLKSPITASRGLDIALQLTASCKYLL